MEQLTFDFARKMGNEDGCHNCYWDRDRGTRCGHPRHPDACLRIFNGIEYYTIGRNFPTELRKHLRGRGKLFYNFWKPKEE